MSLGASYGAKPNPTRQYIATGTFVNDFYTYTTTTDANGLTTGTLTQVVGATPANCPAGRVLRDNGKRLYPNAHPNITYGMIGVFDPQTFLSGFINPNSPRSPCSTRTRRTSLITSVTVTMRALTPTCHQSYQ